LVSFFIIALLHRSPIAGYFILADCGYVPE
jgi:hypothetical protein